MDQAPQKRLEERWRRRQIEQRLTQELHEAQEKYRLANSHLRDLVAEVPSSIASPDSNLRLARARAAVNSALHEVHRALKNWSGFVVCGIDPEGRDRKDPA